MEEKKASVECSVCVEKFNKTTRACVRCQFCSFEVCRGCYQKYCLDQKNTVCMNCKRVHTLSFFYNHVTAVFVKTEWNRAMKEKMFELERAKFPETQMYIEDKTKTKKRLEELSVMLRELKDERSRLTTHLHDIEHKKSTTYTATYILPCPADNCKGLIMNNHTCGICFTKVCGKCNEPVGNANEDSKQREDHECDPEKVKSIDFIKHTTKACPKCGTRIHKIEGCNQIFCVMCHIAFDYRTGQIEKGRIHNPHYFEYLRSISKDGVIRREEDVFECGQQDDNLIGQYELLYTVVNEYPPVHNRFITNVYRNMVHIEHVTKREYSWHNDTSIDAHRRERELREKYLKGEFNQPTFESRIRAIQKRKEKSSEVYPILDTVVKACNDLLKGLPHNFSEEVMTTFMHNLTELVHMMNDAIIATEKTLKCSCLRFGADLSVLRSSGL